jgi:glycosyltransferase involved in cell wall biosynthesis
MTGTTIPPHVCICICTYRRPAYLRHLLASLRDLATENLFTYSVIVADNDRARSAEAVVSECAAASDLRVEYCVEPRQNIALARNKAVAQASGEFVAFLDDDECPTREWLRQLFDACARYGADGALGPVKPRFEEQPPQWIVDGGFYSRPTYPTGYVIDWRKGRTGNLLIKRAVVAADAVPFRPEFLTGEDQDFFRRAIEKGHMFVWCDEAVAYEIVPPVRWTRTFMLKRALLRGRISLLHPSSTWFATLRSLIAVPAYAAALPFALAAGHARFMVYLVKLFDHAGRLLAVAGINPIREPYVTE